MQADAWRNLLGVFTSDGLAHLCTLNLRLAPCSSGDLALLLSHTPTLTSLVLYNLSHVSSLSFFIQLPKLAATLAHLTVKCWYPWRLTVADLPPLLALQQLRELRLLEWPNQEPHIVTAAHLAPFPTAALRRVAASGGVRMDDLLTIFAFHLLAPPVHFLPLVAVCEQICWHVNVVLLSAVSP
jgi:hypothetical protein